MATPVYTLWVLPEIDSIILRASSLLSGFPRTLSQYTTVSALIIRLFLSISLCSRQYWHFFRARNITRSFAEEIPLVFSSALVGSISKLGTSFDISSTLRGEADASMILLLACS